MPSAFALVLSLYSLPPATGSIVTGSSLGPCGDALVNSSDFTFEYSPSTGKVSFQVRLSPTLAVPLPDIAKTGDGSDGGIGGVGASITRHGLSEFTGAMSL